MVHHDNARTAGIGINVVESTLVGTFGVVVDVGVRAKSTWIAWCVIHKDEVRAGLSACFCEKRLDGILLGGCIRNVIIILYNKLESPVAIGRDHVALC